MENRTKTNTGGFVKSTKTIERMMLKEFSKLLLKLREKEV